MFNLFLCNEDAKERLIGMVNKKVEKEDNNSVDEEGIYFDYEDTHDSNEPPLLDVDLFCKTKRKPVASQALLDTGSPICIMSKEEFNKLFYTGPKHTVHSKWSSATGDTQPISFYVMLKGRPRGRKEWFNFKVYISEVLNVPFIMGRDGLNMLGYTLTSSPSKQPYHFAHSCSHCFSNGVLSIVESQTGSKKPGDVKRPFDPPQGNACQPVSGDIMSQLDSTIEEETNKMFKEVRNNDLFLDVCDVNDDEADFLPSKDNVELPDNVKSILNRFPNVTSSELSPECAKIKKFHIKLKEGSKTVKVRPYRTSPTQKAIIEKQIKQLLELGLIFPNTT